jgi:hypothetical protein
MNKLFHGINSDNWLYSYHDNVVVVVDGYFPSSMVIEIVIERHPFYYDVVRSVVDMEIDI